MIGSLFLVRRRRAAIRPSGELILLAHLACVVLVAVVFFGEPRLRSFYDVFGLALLAALVTGRFGLDAAVAPGGHQESPKDRGPTSPAATSLLDAGPRTPSQDREKKAEPEAEAHARASVGADPSSSTSLLWRARKEARAKLGVFAASSA